MKIEIRRGKKSIGHAGTEVHQPWYELRVGDTVIAKGLGRQGPPIGEWLTLLRALGHEAHDIEV